MKRRELLTKTGILLGTLGVSEMFKLDLLEKLSRTVMPEAMAATTPPQRMLEICFREGLPLIQFGASREFAQLGSPKYSNFPYAGSSVIAGQGASNLYFNSSSAPLAKHAANIAITQGITSDGGHTDMFNIRKGATMLSLTTPIVSLSNANTTGAIIGGVKWPGEAINWTNGARDLTKINSSTDFVNLFKSSRLAIPNPQLGTILNAAGQLSQKQADLLEVKLQNTATQSRAYSSAVSIFNTDMSKVLETATLATGLSSKVQVAHPLGCCSPGMADYADVRSSMALSMRAFQHNLINSAMVVVDLGDWHPLQEAGSVSPITLAMSETISDVIDFLKATPEPAGLPGQTLWDTTVIVASSEFNRGISTLGTDNNDGDTQGIMLIGKNVKGNYYGSFDLSGSGKGVAYGFDAKTGASAVGTPTNSTAGAYYTVRKLTGQSASFGESQAAFNAMLKI